MSEIIQKIDVVIIKVENCIRNIRLLGPHSYKKKWGKGVWVKNAKIIEKINSIICHWFGPFGHGQQKPLNGLKWQHWAGLRAAAEVRLVPV